MFKGQRQAPLRTRQRLNGTGVGPASPEGARRQLAPSWQWPERTFTEDVRAFLRRYR
jgi:hypothetical protein